MTVSTKKNTDIDAYLRKFKLKKKKTIVDKFIINDATFCKYINEYWTSKQRQASSLHEISYRACFKAELPRFFINLLTKEKDIVYDPFSGRGTTIIEAALQNRNIIANDINPLSAIISRARLRIPETDKLEARLNEIGFTGKARAKIDLSMFYHPKTECELVSLRNYLRRRHKSGAEGSEDYLDRWIRMIATNRLTGHSPGFFSVYTLPPNQAVLPKSQIKINKKRKQTPEYKNVKEIILRKSKSLIRNISQEEIARLKLIEKKALFLSGYADQTPEIKNACVQLTVTSPPFLNIVQYSKDNWLRCWFNDIDTKKIEKKITMSKTIASWTTSMQSVFHELYRITKYGGYVAFEVGEIRSGKVKLDEHVAPLGIEAGFKCLGVLVNAQSFSKTANIWGIDNNVKGTNTNRVVIFRKDQ